MHVTGDDVRIRDVPGMLIRKTAKPCINSIHGFVPVKTCLLIAFDTAFYAINIYLEAKESIQVTQF